MKMKKLLAFFTVVCMACASFVVPVSAGNGPNPNEGSFAWVMVTNGTEDVYLYSAPEPENVSTLEGMSYDQTTNTLTLNGFNGMTQKIVTNEMGDDFKIAVQGENHIQQIYAWGYGYGGSVALIGDGTLIINENKQLEIPIYLDAEGAKATFHVAPELTLKAYGQTGYPAICVSYSSAASDGISFENNDDMNTRVVRTEISTPKSANVYRAGNSVTLYSCTPKDTSDTGSYGASQYLDDNFEPHYVIYRIVEDDDLGKICIKAFDDTGNSLNVDDFDISEDEYVNMPYIDPNWPSHMELYAKEGETAQYGCYAVYIVDGDSAADAKLTYSMYRLVEKTIGDINGLFAVPVTNEQSLSEMPEGYTQVPGNTYYSYDYDEETIDITGTVSDPCTDGHTEKTTVTKATTTRDGKIVTTCSVCGKTLSTTVIPKASGIKLSTNVYTYDGKTKAPSVAVKDSKGKALKKNKDYTISYASGRKLAGKYTVTVKLIGNYAGTKTYSYTINPPKTSVSSLETKNKAMIVRWKKQSTQTSGYQIQYSTDKTFNKNVKSTTVSKNTTTAKKISSLTTGKKYYVRIRTYKTVKVGGKSTKLYSSWSSSKAVIIK